MIYHILGSDIPHHNQTVLTFFQNELLAKTGFVEQQFWLVGDVSLIQAYPKLNIRCFGSKKEIAKSVVRLAKQNKKVKFLLHGQYNVALWLAILFGSLPSERCYWHIWGADLYEDSQALKFRLFYPLRRLAQKRLSNVLGTMGDLSVFKTINPNANCQPLYFPTRLPDVKRNNHQRIKEHNEQICILLGNSGDASNRHITGLTQIKACLGTNVKIILPMGYPENNDVYIQNVRMAAKQLFPNQQVEILTQKLDFERYLALLNQCDLGWFSFERQQGIGTICLLTTLNIPCVLNPQNPFVQDLKQHNVPFLLSDNVQSEQIGITQQLLQQLDTEKIAFFYPRYIQMWIDLLHQIKDK